jgi:hypothetical protein
VRRTIAISFLSISQPKADYPANHAVARLPIHIALSGIERGVTASVTRGRSAPQILIQY